MAFGPVAAAAPMAGAESDREAGEADAPRIADLSSSTD